MPDWTYQPLRPFAEAVLGGRRTQLALRFLAVLITRAGGRKCISDAGHLRAANPHLLAFIAHDRAGFGGALVGAGLAVLLISMWGWRRGQSWVWWCLLLGCAVATMPALIVHFAIGYTHFEHLAPVYVLVAATATALGLSKNYLTAKGSESKLVIAESSGV